MIQTHATVALIALAVGTCAGWTLRDWKADADRLADLDLQTREAARDAQRVDSAATSYEAQRAVGQQRTRIVVKEVERVIQADPVAYADRCLTDDGLRLVAQALAGADPAGVAASALPAATTSR